LSNYCINKNQTQRRKFEEFFTNRKGIAAAVPSWTDDEG